MQKYLLALTLRSLPAVAMYSEIVTDQEENIPVKKVFAPKTEQPTIVGLSYTSHFRWHDIEAKLSNGDILTFTKFLELNESACIHTIAVDDAHEIRVNASTYWHRKMENIYLDKTRPSHNKAILSI
jgi:hypothetical protein